MPCTSGAAPAAWKPNIRGAAPISLEAAPVGGDVAGVADGDAERVEVAFEVLVDLEGGRLLAFDAELVDGVDERDRVRVGQLAHERERVVEVAVRARSRARRASSVCAILPAAILPSGTITAQVMPARAA